MQIREMEIVDLPRIVELENQLFTSPWSYHDFAYEILENEFSFHFVLEDHHMIIGYISLWMMYEQSQILSIGIDQNYQGKGLGKELLLWALTYLSDHQVCNVTLEVRVSNRKAISLYQSVGFEKKAVRKNYYQDNHEDAYLMLKEWEGEK